MKTHRLTVAGACALAVAFRFSGQAQTATNSPSVMQKSVIEGIPIEETVVPTARPFNSVYGTDRSILDTPRNVTIISREQLDAISIKDVRDFTKLTTSSYTRSNFGAPTTPDIRGQSADTFVNGMRKGLTSNGNGLPVNFNSVESVNIVKGPASVVYGASQYVGGYVDLITKKPYFDDFRGTASGTVGMYDLNQWNLDFGGPIGDGKKAGYRISYSGEDSGSYYFDAFKKSQAIYGALGWQVSDNYSIDFNAEYFQSSYTENWGINRPTQLLIDQGLYRTGININNGAGNPPSDPQNSLNVKASGNTIAYGPDVLIDRRIRLLKPNDGSFGQNFNAQLLQKVNLGEHLEIVNNTFGSWIDRNTLSDYYYSEILKDNWSVENRTETRFSFTLFNLENSVNTGISERYQDVETFVDFANEPAAVWDLTQDRNFIYFPDATKLANKSLPVPGYFNRYATPGSTYVDPVTGKTFVGGNGSTAHSQAFQVGPFFEDDLKITDKLSLLYGGRVDMLWVSYVDPLAPAGYVAKSDNTSAALPNANASLVYKLTPKVSSYVTYNYSQSTGASTGGGYSTSSSQFQSRYFHRASDLYEGGFKFSSSDNKFFASVAGFQQNRIISSLGNIAPNEVLYRGAEFEVNYQPDRNFYTTFGYSFIQGTLLNQAPFSVRNVTTNPDNLPSKQLGFGGYPLGDYDQPGLPSHIFNFLATYKLPGGLGLSFGGTVTSDWNQTYDGNIVVPWQFSLDGRVFYDTKRFRAEVAFFNITDEKNWSPPNATYATESIYAEPPFRIEGRVTVKF
jgi:outer membrane receptor protein involved in Fe transport